MIDRANNRCGGLRVKEALHIYLTAHQGFVREVMPTTIGLISKGFLPIFP